ncbi:hypothetical protein GAMM_230007 [Gammaproteobacteria bacterium]
MSKPVTAVVDGIGLNARHFAAKKKDEAVKAMETDGISNDANWSAKAYDTCVKACADFDAAESAEEKKLAGKDKPGKEPERGFLQTKSGIQT